MKRGFTITEMIITFVLAVVVFIVIYPVIAPRHGCSGRLTSCINNQKQIVTAMLMFAQDHSEKLPTTAAFWSSLSLDKGVLVCPMQKPRRANSYGVNAKIGGLALGAFGDVTVVPVTADSDTTGNIIMLPTNLAARHTEKCVVGFLDGHVAAVAPGEVNLVVKLKKAGK